MEFEIIHTFLGFREVWYIKDNVRNYYTLAKEMGLTYSNFKAVLNNQFNGQQLNASGLFFFRNEKDAVDALDWMETTIVAHKLSEV